MFLNDITRLFTMFVNDLNGIPLEQEVTVFMDCVVTNDESLAFATRVNNVGGTGFQFDRYNSGFTSILCIDKVEWMNGLKDHAVIYVADDWEKVQHVRQKCPGVKSYFLLNWPDFGAILFTLIAVSILSVFLFYPL